MSKASLTRELLSCAESYHEGCLVHVRSSSSCFNDVEKSLYLSTLRFAAKHTKQLVKIRVITGQDGRDVMCLFLSMLDKRRSELFAYRSWYLHELTRIHARRVLHLEAW